MTCSVSVLQCKVCYPVAYGSTVIWEDQLTLSRSPQEHPLPSSKSSCIRHFIFVGSRIACLRLPPPHTHLVLSILITFDPSSLPSLLSYTRLRRTTAQHPRTSQVLCPQAQPSSMWSHPRRDLPSAHSDGFRVVPVYSFTYCSLLLACLFPHFSDCDSSCALSRFSSFSPSSRFPIITFPHHP